VIYGNKVCAILPCHLLMLHLGLSWLEVPLVSKCPLLYSRLCPKAIWTTVEAGAVVVVHNRRVVDVRIVNDRPVHVHDSGVICESATAPFAAVETTTWIAEAIVHAAIKADVRAPIAAMPQVHTARSIAPVARCP